jgi:hypothetical protein
MYIVPAFVYVLVAILIPLQVTYWQEEAAKHGYFHALCDSKCHGLLVTPMAVRVMYFLMWSVAAWALLYMGALLLLPSVAS